MVIAAPQTLQKFFCVGHGHLNTCFWIVPEKSRQRPGDDKLAYSSCHSKMIRKSTGVRCQQRLFQKDFVIFHGGGLLQQKPSGRRQCQGLAAVGKQGDAVMFFQIANVLRDGWLGDKKLLRRLCVIHVFTYC